MGSPYSPPTICASCKEELETGSQFTVCAICDGGVHFYRSKCFHEIPRVFKSVPRFPNASLIWVCSNCFYSEL